MLDSTFLHLYYILLTVFLLHFNFISQFVHEKVIRGGRRVEISIYDLVVGDVIPLNIGNQVHDLFICCFAFYTLRLHFVFVINFSVRPRSLLTEL